MAIVLEFAAEFRDVTIVDDADSGKRILEIEVRGKRGSAIAKACPARCGRLRDSQGEAPSGVLR